MEQAKQKELRSLADDRANLADREAALMKEIKQLEDKIVDQEKHWSQANVRPPEADAQGDERTRYMQRQMQFARERGLAMAELQGKRKKLQEARSQLETHLTLSVLLPQCSPLCPQRALHDPIGGYRCLPVLREGVLHHYASASLRAGHHFRQLLG